MEYRKERREGRRREGNIGEENRKMKAEGKRKRREGKR